MEQRGRSGFGFRTTLGVSTFLMTAILIVGVVILVNGSLALRFPVDPSANPGRNIAFLLAVPALLAGLLAIGSRADRRCVDDFAFQLLASGALVGMATMILFQAIWALDFLPPVFGIRDLRGQDMMAAGLLGWAVGYFTFRVRGLK